MKTTFGMAIAIAANAAFVDAFGLNDIFGGLATASNVMLGTDFNEKPEWKATTRHDVNRWLKENHTRRIQPMST